MFPFGFRLDRSTVVAAFSSKTYADNCLKAFSEHSYITDRSLTAVEVSFETVVHLCKVAKDRSWLCNIE